MAIGKASRIVGMLEHSVIRRGLARDAVAWPLGLRTDPQFAAFRRSALKEALTQMVREGKGREAEIVNRLDDAEAGALLAAISNEQLLGGHFTTAPAWIRPTGKKVRFTPTSPLMEMPQAGQSSGAGHEPGIN